MKFAAAILAALTLFLTAQEPVLSARWQIDAIEISPEESSCSAESSSCKKEKPVTSADENPGKCCDTNFCNPFGACCPFMLIERPVLAASSWLVKDRLKILVDDNTLSTYVQDVWNPPKEISLPNSSTFF